MLQEDATKDLSEPIQKACTSKAEAASTIPNDLALTIFTLQTEPRVKFPVPTFLPPTHLVLDIAPRMGLQIRHSQPDPWTRHQLFNSKPTTAIAPLLNPRWRNESSSRKSISASRRLPKALQSSSLSTRRSSNPQMLLKRRSKKTISSVRSRSCKGFGTRSRHGRLATTSKTRGRCWSIGN
jgi:hypothetical protein